MVLAKPLRPSRIADDFNGFCNLIILNFVMLQAECTTKKAVFDVMPLAEIVYEKAVENYFRNRYTSSGIYN